MLHVLALVLVAAAFAQTPRQAADRALDYLSNEVPAWKKENGCYSCHNNGDAARALMVGGRGAAIPDTLQWLAQPDKWDRQQASAAFRDEKLARVQFAFALAQAIEKKLITGREALKEAARALQQIQAADGSWPLEQEASVGSPATYGTALATYASLRVLQLDGSQEAAVRKAQAWLRAQKPVATPDLAATIFAGDDRARDTLLKMQTSDGGWGPYRATSAEAFDTALAVLALGPNPAAKVVVERGVQWLVKNQLENGGWAATTRPSGNVSYAQHISTTGWATLALLSRLKP